jgi:gamma-glutamylcyclotransferase (GGCT)/AIG2-like uncharacterized protein YtfP
MTNYLFVYGTLLRRSRHPMARFLEQRARYVGTAKVRGRLYDLGRFPGMTPTTADEWVQGDLYDLGDGSTTLAELDAYELAESPLPAVFERQAGDVTRGDGTSVTAWIWWYRGDVAESQRIVSGRFEKNCDPAPSHG